MPDLLSSEVCHACSPKVYFSFDAAWSNTAMVWTVGCVASSLPAPASREGRWRSVWFHIPSSSWARFSESSRLPYQMNEYSQRCFLFPGNVLRMFPCQPWLLRTLECLGGWGGGDCHLVEGACLLRAGRWKGNVWGAGPSAVGLLGVLRIRGPLSVQEEQMGRCWRGRTSYLVRSDSLSPPTK